MTPEEKRERQREYHRRWTAANLEKERTRKREAARRKYAENPEEAREARYRWRAENRERHLAARRRWYVANADGERERQRQWTAENPDSQRQWRAANPTYDRDWMRRWRHSGDVAQMEEAQMGNCYLCGDPLPDDQSKRRVDHDHRCCPPGKSCQYCRRGIACHPCNVLIGLARDDPQRLRRIAGNLEVARADVTQRLAGKAVQEELFESCDLGSALWPL